MVLEARLRIRHHGCFTESIDDTAQVTLLGSDRRHGVLIVHAADDAAAEAVLSEMTRTAHEVAVIERSPGAAVVRCECPPDGVLSTIMAFGCTVLWPAVFRRGSELYTVMAPSRERLDALVGRLGELAEVELERLAEVSASALDVSVSLADVTSDLTGRQVEVLRAAIERGYYESPRRVSAEALAESFGVSRSTLQEHLRKAEQRVLERFASVLSAHPSLLAAAARRPGRPPRGLA